jgi:hypothetical protein
MNTVLLVVTPWIKPSKKPEEEGILLNPEMKVSCFSEKLGSLRAKRLCNPEGPTLNTQKCETLKLNSNMSEYEVRDAIQWHKVNAEFRKLGQLVQKLKEAWCSHELMSLLFLKKS